MEILTNALRIQKRKKVGKTTEDVSSGAESREWDKGLEEKGLTGRQGMLLLPQRHGVIRSLQFIRRKAKYL